MTSKLSFHLNVEKGEILAGIAFAQAKANYAFALKVRTEK